MVFDAGMGQQHQISLVSSNLLSYGLFANITVVVLKNQAKAILFWKPEVCLARSAFIVESSAPSSPKMASIEQILGRSFSTAYHFFQSQD